MEQIAEILIERGLALLNCPLETWAFTQNENADGFLSNLDSTPHGFVLACLMDRQIKAERAWLIPYLVGQEIGDLSFSAFLSLDLPTINAIFSAYSLHRFNTNMAEIFFLGIHRIHEQYHDDASEIWRGNPSSATVVRRFLEFKGAGIKIATMAANILAREFKIPMADKYSIDISPDVQVRRVFGRLGLVELNAATELIIYAARELNPEYPGIFDLSVWEIGKNWCRPQNPACSTCYLNLCCPKVGLETR